MGPLLPFGCPFREQTPARSPITPIAFLERFGPLGCGEVEVERDFTTTLPTVKVLLIGSRFRGQVYPS